MLTIFTIFFNIVGLFPPVIQFVFYALAICTYLLGILKLVGFIMDLLPFV